MATCGPEAKLLEERGVDGIIAQGNASGGHRAMFGVDDPDPEIEVLDLVKELHAVTVPIVAAGGIMDGHGVRKAIPAGASSAMLGTAFLLCPEAGTSDPYRKAIRDSISRSHKPSRVGAEAESSRSMGTRKTRAFSGRLARGLPNQFQLDLERSDAVILPYPAQNAYTKDVKSASSAKGSSEAISLWAGKGFDKIREMDAASLVRTLYREMDNE